VGKENAAVAFAKACNCEREISGHDSERGTTRVKKSLNTIRQPITVNPCGRCKSCRKIESDHHPDVIRIKPSGPFIRIDQIRTLCQTLAMKPYEARTRVVIISDAQAMNPAAGNALLKMLEEPPVRTILILLATQTADLLPTIVSRCQHIRFNPISRKSLSAELVRAHGLEPAKAMIIATLADGSFTRALNLYRKDWISRRNWLVKELDSLPAASTGRLLAFGEKLAQNKDALPEAFDVMASWFHDLIMAKFCPDKIINQDLAQTVRQSSQKISLDTLFLKIDAIQSTQNAIQAGTNLRLAMEAMLLKL
jgi:DNA polymerase-3 subunit delta'